MGFAKQTRFLPAPGPAIGLPSPLGSQMSGQKGGGNRKKDMSTPLMLTALVDAFSILVIFLLVQMSAAPNTFEAQDGIKLPQAASVDEASTAEVINLSVRDGGFFVDGQAVSKSKLAEALKRDKPSRLVIHADQTSDFDSISPILAATAEAKIEKLEFAVEVDETIGGKK